MNKTISAPNVTLYGFYSANTSNEPAWFHSFEAAQRFAASCGWGDAKIETTDSDSADSADVMDTPEKPWTKTDETISAPADKNQVAEIDSTNRALSRVTDRHLIEALLANKVNGWDYYNGFLSRHDESTGNLSQVGRMSPRHAGAIILEEADLYDRMSALL
jgi:hypothetical protein